ncbi:MAG: hypothetical protein JHD02_04280 [Thermoleophilaceae bacterium]|nr:hypothetical protein [Thermoleophilaceae bacterium]
MRSRFSGHKHVTVQAIEGMPPTEYEVIYRLKGLTRDGTRPRVTHRHVCKIRLGIDYPRAAPYVEATSEVFHPNVAGHYCIGDIWTPAESIADVIERIGEMIQWQEFNVNSALNADAALYANAHPELFPLDRVELTPPEAEVEITLNRPASGSTNKAGAKPDYPEQGD